MTNSNRPSKHSENTTGKTSEQNQVVLSEERRRMIAEVAYFRAMQRGFDNGNPLDDWVSAEREINRLLPTADQQKQERAAYETLRQQVTNRLAEVRDSLNADTIHQALERSVTHLRQLGEYTSETVEKVRGTVEKELAVAAQKIGPRWQAFSEKTADLFHIWRDRSQQFLSSATKAASDWLREVSGRLHIHTYRTGEMTAPGKLECTVCGARLELATPGHLPRCSNCKNTEFKRI